MKMLARFDRPVTPLHCLRIIRCVVVPLVDRFPGWSDLDQPQRILAISFNLAAPVAVVPNAFMFAIVLAWSGSPIKSHRSCIVSNIRLSNRNVTGPEG